MLDGWSRSQQLKQRSDTENDKQRQSLLRNTEAKKRPHGLGAVTITHHDQLERFGKRKRLEHVAQAWSAGRRQFLGEVLQPDVSSGYRGSARCRKQAEQGVGASSRALGVVYPGDQGKDTDENHEGTLRDAQRTGIELERLLQKDYGEEHGYYGRQEQQEEERSDGKQLFHSESGANRFVLLIVGRQVVFKGQLIGLFQRFLALRGSLALGFQRLSNVVVQGPLPEVPGPAVAVV